MPDSDKSADTVTYHSAAGKLVKQTSGLTLSRVHALHLNTTVCMHQQRCSPCAIANLDLEVPPLKHGDGKLCTLHPSFEKSPILAFGLFLDVLDA